MCLPSSPLLLRDTIAANMDTSTIVVALVVILIPLATVGIPAWRRSLRSWTKLNGAYDTMYPVFGNFLTFRKFAQNLQMDSFWLEMSKKYGTIVYVRIFTREFVVIASAPLAKYILNNPGEEDFIRSGLLRLAMWDLTPFALFSLPSGDVWKKHRKFLQPAFGPSQLRHAFHVATKEADAHLEHLKAEIATGKVVNMHQILTSVTGQVIAQVSFSYDLNQFNHASNVKAVEGQPNDDLIKYSEDVLEIINLRMGVPPLIWPLLGAGKADMLPRATKVHNLLRNMIKTKQEAIAASGSALKLGKFGGDLLDRMIDANNRAKAGDAGIDADLRGVTFTDEELMGEGIGFLGAGHETTANSLAWGFYTLTQYPEIYDKLVSEIEQVCNPDRPWTMDRLPELRYMDAFIKETLRYFAIVPNIIRTTVRDYVDPQSGARIPKGMNLMINIQAMHHSREYWGDDVEDFKPERWLVEGFNPVPGSYIPFSDGPFNCIGQKLSLMEMKIILAKLLPLFRPELAMPKEDVKHVYSITRGLKNGLFVKLAPRTV
ncbi:cytochrome P450, partial [Cladochytrium replicatum]